MDQDITWRGPSDGDENARRRLQHCEAVLAQITTGVALLEPVADPATLELTMVNDVAAAYYGRVGEFVNKLADTEAGMRASGLFDLALLVSLTGQEHMQEGLSVPGPAAAGCVIDLAITPLEGGAVSIVFDDVTRSVRQAG